MTMLTAALLYLLGEKATKDNTNLSAFVKEDVEEYAYFSAVVRGKKDQVITLKSMKRDNVFLLTKTN